MDEVHKTHIEHLGRDKKLADTCRKAVTDAFPEAFIRGFEKLTHTTYDE